MDFFAIIGFMVCFGLTFGSAAYILWQGYWMSKMGSSYPIGALVAAGFFVALGCLVVYLAPFHIHLTP
jgi:drug/metabolite transporter (DMT)-like permease